MSIAICLDSMSIRPRIGARLFRNGYTNLSVNKSKGRMSAPARSTPTNELYSDHVNPQWVKLLDLLQMNVQYERCTGTELHASGGRQFLDFLSGYCVHNTGHNHPGVVQALQDELGR